MKLLTEKKEVVIVSDITYCEQCVCESRKEGRSGVFINARMVVEAWALEEGDDLVVKRSDD